MDPVDLKNDIWEALRGTAVHMDSLFRPCYKAYGLTVGQTRILSLLDAQGELSGGALSRQLDVAPGNLSVACKKLENAGLLLRRRDPADERLALFFLSPAGKETVNRLREDLDRRCADVLKEMPPESLEEILQGLALLRGLLEKAEERRQPEKERKEDRWRT